MFRRKLYKLHCFQSFAPSVNVSSRIFNVFLGRGLLSERAVRVLGRQGLQINGVWHGVVKFFMDLQFLDQLPFSLVLFLGLEDTFARLRTLFCRFDYSSLQQFCSAGVFLTITLMVLALAFCFADPDLANALLHSVARSIANFFGRRKAHKHRHRLRLKNHRVRRASIDRNDQHNAPACMFLIALSAIVCWLAAPLLFILLLVSHRSSLSCVRSFRARPVFCLRAIALRSLRSARRCTCIHGRFNRRNPQIGGLGYSFDSTKGYPGEGPEQVCTLGDLWVASFAFSSLQEHQLQRVRILQHLLQRKLGTGEPVYVSSLANQLHISFDAMKDRLRELQFPIHNHGRWPAIETPSSDILNEKLAALGVDTVVSKPMSARYNGYHHKIDAITSCEPCSGGQFRFNVTWSSHLSHLPVSVCCHDLNNSARLHVTSRCGALFILVSRLAHRPPTGLACLYLLSMVHNVRLR